MVPVRPVPELPQALVQALEAGGEGIAVLAIRLGAMGDVLRTVPAVRLMRRAWPRARIDWIVDGAWRVLLDPHPDLDHVLALPRGEWDAARGAPADWPALGVSMLRFARGLRRSGYDLAVDFHGNLRSGLVAYASGAPVRIGYSGHQQKEGNRLWTTHRVPAGPRRTSRVDRNLALARAVGAAGDPLPSCGLTLPDRGEAELSRVASGVERPFALIAAGVSARQAYKKPPPELLAGAARALAARGATAWVVWGPGERPDAEAVVAASAGAARLAPKTTLPALAALLRRSRLLVGGDTGPLHLACAVGCPVVAIYGPTDPEVNRPWGVPCRAVHPPDRRYTGIKRHDRGSGGFDGLTGEAVARAVEELLDETGG